MPDCYPATTVEVAAFTLGFSGESCGSELFNSILRSIRTTWVLRLNGKDIEWGCIHDSGQMGATLHYREWNEDEGIATGPVRQIRVMDIDELYVY